ncbi:MAG: hypothetical protein IKU67_05675 [Firmicutes bacterium]|nr:hypothetical protein [Bacillota bacterium]
MKKSTTKSIKTTASKPIPETTITANIEVTVIINDEVSKKEAIDILHDIFDGADVDDMQFKNVKTFFHVKEEK